MLTDGSAEINRDITASEAELTIDAGVRLVPLGVGLRDRTEIEYIAETQQIPLMEIESEGDFEKMSDEVLKAVHDRKSYHCLKTCLWMKLASFFSPEFNDVLFVSYFCHIYATHFYITFILIKTLICSVVTIFM